MYGQTKPLLSHLQDERLLQEGIQIFCSGNLHHNLSAADFCSKNPLCPVTSAQQHSYLYCGFFSRDLSYSILKTWTVSWPKKSKIKVFSSSIHVAGLEVMRFPLCYYFALGALFSWPSLNFFPIETKILCVCSNQRHLTSPMHWC